MWVGCDRRNQDYYLQPLRYENRANIRDLFARDTVVISSPADSRNKHSVASFKTH